MYDRSNREMSSDLCVKMEIQDQTQAQCLKAKGKIARKLGKRELYDCFDKIKIDFAPSFPVFEMTESKIRHQ